MVAKPGLVRGAERAVAAVGAAGVQHHLRFVCAAPLATTVQPPLPRAATDDVADLQGWAIVMVVLAALVVGLCLLGLAMGKYPHVALELMT